MIPNSCASLFLELLVLQHFLVDGFVIRHPSGLPAPSTVRFGVKAIVDPVISTKHSLLNMVASATSDAVRNATVPETNSSVGNARDREQYYEEREGDAIRRYPWSEMQQWALRDNLPKYTIRIPVKRTETVASANSETPSPSSTEDTVLASFALWRSLQNDVPELAGYPIDFLRARHEETLLRQEGNNDAEGDDDSASIRVVQRRTTPGVLPFLQAYEFAAGGGICGDVYGMNGVSDGSRIETSTLRNVKESLPKGYVQTSDGCASFELGAPLRTDERIDGKGGPVGSTVAAATAVKDLGVETLSDLSANQLRSLANSAVVEDGDGMLLRLGAMSGVMLAGATAINMLSHHLTVNVFWV